MSGVRVRIDLHRCVGAGTCMAVAPTVFGWRKGAWYKADVLDPTTVEEEVLREAALACPTQAILLEDDDPPAPRAGPATGAPS
jgi:ferredoxin